MAWRKTSSELAAFFGAAIPTDPRIERRSMFGCPVALVNGAMFAVAHQDSFVLKLSEQDRTTLRDAFDAHGYEFSPGRGIRDFVAMPDEILMDREALAGWIVRSMDYVAAKKRARPAKPKASAKAKTGKSAKSSAAKRRPRRTSA